MNDRNRASLGLQPTDDVGALALSEAHSVPGLGGAGAMLLAALLIGATGVRRAAGCAGAAAREPTPA